ncbi:acyltransferase [uncultured Arcticibacterium sp.]|uniref:acyltransferase family protein n=1 Tax=uncultured Arcticibacterium sp. TaxID=2173042 RepID=UPI0030FB494A
MKRLLAIEWLRGFAALSVCIMHFFNASGYFGESDPIFTSFLGKLTLLGRMGVPIFFVISGFIIPYSMWHGGYTFPEKIRNFLARRFARIEPPYILSIFVCLIVWYVIRVFVEGGSYAVDWKNILMHLGYLNVIDGEGWILGVYWTLGVEFQYYLLISFLFPILFLGTKIRRIVSALVLLGLSFWLSKYVHDGLIFRHIPLFLAGIFTFQYRENLLDLKWFLFLLLIILAALSADLGLLNVFSAVFVVVVILFNIDIRFKPMYFLGTISYSLYLMHWTFGVDISMRFFKYILPDISEIGKIAVVIVCVFISIPLSYLYYLLIEKPAIRWGKKLK